MLREAIGPLAILGKFAFHFDFEVAFGGPFDEDGHVSPAAKFEAKFEI